MTKKLYLSKLEKKYRIVYLHNPKHFNLSNLWIENLPNGHKLLCANPRRHSKPFHRLALLKPLDKKTFKRFITNEGEVPFGKGTKPFNGIFQD